MAVTLPRPRGAAGYTHVPTFRFATPPRTSSRDVAQGVGIIEDSMAKRLDRDVDLALEQSSARENSARSDFQFRLATESHLPATFAMPHLDMPSATLLPLTSLEPSEPQPTTPLDVEAQPPPGPAQDELQSTTDELPVEAPASSMQDFGAAVNVPDEIAKTLKLAYDGETEGHAMNLGVSGFRWTGVVDAAHAAWIGGTRLLRYGEVLPGGVAKASSWLATGSSPDVNSRPDANIGQRQLCLELGMGRGRLALQLFLSGATVIGVELASERWKLAAAAFERLAHRCPERFEISKRTETIIRIRQRGGPKGAICEARLGSFFDVVTAAEVHAATIIFCQVCLPPPTWPQVRTLCSNTSPGCRLLTYEDLEKIWRGDNSATLPAPFPFDCLGTPRLACSWAPQKGHRFYIYEHVETVPCEPDSSDDEIYRRRGQRGATAR